MKANPALDYAHLPIRYGADEKDDWTSEATHIKANPNWGNGVEPDYIKRACIKAQELPSFENEFKRLHLNIWTEQAEKFLSIEAWNKCPTIDVEPGKDIWVGGLDTSSTTDLTAFALYNPARFALRVWFFIPGEHAHQKSLLDGVDYVSWARNPKAQLIFTGSKRIERDTIKNKILELKKIYRIGGVAFDPWEGKIGLIDELQKAGVRMIEFGQSYANMNSCTKELERLVIEHKLNHGANPCLDWNAQNLCVKRLDEFVRPSKGEDLAKRIDGIVSGIMAIGISKSIQAVTIRS